MAPIDVGRRLDQGNWAGYQKWLVFLTALTIVFDGIDNQLLGVAIPSIMQEWLVPRAAFSPVVSLGYADMMMGGALAGLAGDRFGRRSALRISMALFGIMTAAGAGAAGPLHLAIVRLLAGAGLGGAIPNAAALAAEYVPLRPAVWVRRPRSSGCLSVDGRSCSSVLTWAWAARSWPAT